LEFNLVVIHEPGIDNYSWVRNYVRQLLGDRVEYVSSYQSVILYRVDDPRNAAKVIKESLAGRSTPIIKVIPADYVVDPDITKVSEVVKELASKIPPNETFRITLEGHLFRTDEEGFVSELGTLESIRELAKYIDRPVDLENPQWVVYVRVVRYHRVMKKAVVSLLKPEDLKRL
jgi:tRNA acetyltransferase TAN1